jgi:hypothetical protein
VPSTLAMSQTCYRRALERRLALANTRWCRYPKDELDADFTIDDPEAPTRPWVPAKSPQGFDQLGRIKAMFGADGKPLQPAQPLPPVFHKYRGHGIVEELSLSPTYIQWSDTLSLMLTVRAASPCRRRQSSRLSVSDREPPLDLLDCSSILARTTSNNLPATGSSPARHSCAVSSLRAFSMHARLTASEHWHVLACANNTTRGSSTLPATTSDSRASRRAANATPLRWTISRQPHL